MNKNILHDILQQFSSPLSDCEEPPIPFSYVPPSFFSLFAWFLHHQINQIHLLEPGDVAQLLITLFALFVALLSYLSPLSQERCYLGCLPAGLFASFFLN